MASENTPDGAETVTPPAAESAATAKPAGEKAHAQQAKLQTARKAAQKPKTEPKPEPKAKSAKARAKKPSSPRKPSAPRRYTGDSAMAAAKKDAAKETFETMTAASNEAVKEGFEKSLNAINEFSAFQKDTVDAVIASATATSKSIEEMNSATMAYAKKSMEDGVAAAKTMAGAKSVQELIEIQADYAKSSLDAYLSEVNKHTDLMSALVKDGFKPLNDRMAAAVEAMQSQR